MASGFLSSKRRKSDGQKNAAVFAAATSSVKDFFSYTRMVSSVQLVLGGTDPKAALHTLRVTETAIRDYDTLSPIVVLGGTGGIADIIG